MRNSGLKSQHQKISNLIQSTQEFSHEDIELQGHWAKYLCVLAVGFLENAIKEVYANYAKISAKPEVYTFTRNKLKFIRSPKASTFVSTARSFKKEWGEELDRYFENDQSAKGAIDSLINQRHLIAHGNNSSISIAQVNDYLERSIAVVEFIENQCNR